MNKGTDIQGGVGVAAPHESAHLHVSGEARYTDDIPVPEKTLYAAIGTSERAHARIRSLDLTAVASAPGVVTVLTAADIPGENNHGPVVHDDPIFAANLVEYVGQSMFAVVATSVEAARIAARLAVVEYEELEPILDIKTAIAKQSFVMPTKTLRRGEPAARIRAAAHRLTGEFAIGSQDHFYLEGQIALAEPGEDETMLVHSSTQHISEVQRLVADMLGLRAKDVVIQCRRMGGGFGGKETQPALIACIAALGAWKTGVPVKLRLDRDADMQVTGKRHPFDVAYDVGFDNEGRILGATITLAADCGRSADLSDAVNVRAMFRIAREAVPYIRQRGHGRIINVGSIMSDMGGPGLCAYGSSKHAVAGLTKAMAIDLGKYQITVNYLQPGAIVTALSEPFFEDAEFRAYWEKKAPVGRLGQPEDVAAAALFLASDDAEFISGVGLNVDGGAIVNF